MTEWRPIADGFIRRCPDGEWEFVRQEKVGRTLRRNAERRKASKSDPRSEECSDGGRMTASMPRIYFEQMQHECGNDPEKEQMFLRDHPEVLTVTPRQANVPKRRSYSFPKRLRGK